jgi:hypothetical protein
VEKAKDLGVTCLEGGTYMLQGVTQAYIDSKKGGREGRRGEIQRTLVDFYR